MLYTQEKGEGGGQSRRAITGSSCVPSGLCGGYPAGSLLVLLGTGALPTWPAARRLGHLGPESVASD